MGKMKDLDILLNDIKDQAIGIINSIDELRSILSAKPDEDPEFDDWEDYKQEELFHDAALEEKEQPITIEDVRPVLAEISRSGKTALVKELLKKYGANKLSEVKPENLKALLKDAEAI